MSDQINIQKQLTDAAKAFNNGDVKHAEATYLSVLHADPQNFKAKLWLGSLYADVGKDKEAALLLEDAISLNPKHYQSYLVLGRIQVKRKQNQDALKTFFSGLDLCAIDKLNESEFCYNIAKLNMELGEYNHALTYAKRALECRPNYPEAEQVRLYAYQRT